RSREGPRGPAGDSRRLARMVGTTPRALPPRPCRERFGVGTGGAERWLPESQGRAGDPRRCDGRHRGGAAMRKPPDTSPHRTSEDGIRAQHARYGAAEATVDAVMFSLRERGLAALAEEDTQDR